MAAIEVGGWEVWEDKAIEGSDWWAERGIACPRAEPRGKPLDGALKTSGTSCGRHISDNIFTA